MRPSCDPYILAHGAGLGVACFYDRVCMIFSKHGFMCIEQFSLQGCHGLLQRPADARSSSKCCTSSIPSRTFCCRHFPVVASARSFLPFRPPGTSRPVSGSTMSAIHVGGHLVVLLSLQVWTALISGNAETFPRASVRKRGVH